MTKQEIATELAKRVEADQSARSEDPVDWNKVSKIDTENTKFVKEVVSEFGWLKLSEFGEEAVHQAWLLAQHADHDVEFQKKCLNLMEGLPKEEVVSKDLAYLTDRVLMKSVGVQRYGTQYLVMPTYVLVHAVEEPHKLDEIRQGVGLDKMAEYLSKHGLPAFLVDRVPIN